MIKGVHSVGLAVTDIEAALAGFGRALPLQPLGSGFARGPNAFLEFMQTTAAPEPQPVNAPGIGHVCIQGRDIGVLRAALEQGGAAFLSDPVDLGTGFLYAYGRTNEGLLFETEGAPFAPADPPAWFGHIAIVTPDIDRLQGFYAALLNRPVTPGMRLRGSRRYNAVTGLAEVDVRAAWIPGAPISLEFWQYLNPPTLAGDAPRGEAPGWTHLTLESDDVPGDLARAVREGATIEAGPEPMVGGERASFLDPDGNRVRLVRWAEAASPLSIAALPHPDILARVQAARQAAANASAAA